MFHVNKCSVKKETSFCVTVKKKFHPFNKGRGCCSAKRNASKAAARPIGPVEWLFVCTCGNFLFPPMGRSSKSSYAENNYKPRYLTIGNKHFNEPIFCAGVKTV